MEPCTFKPRLKKFLKKNPPRENFLCSNIFSKESCSYISGNGNPEKVSYIFWKESFSCVSGNGNSEQILYISGNRTLSYFGKGIFRTLTYLEPWYIQNSSIFRTRSIFRTLLYSEPESYSEHYQTSTMKSLLKFCRSCIYIITILKL